MEEFQPMWDGHLVRISIGNRRIELTPGKTILSALYRQGQSHENLKMSEIYQLLEMEVKGPADPQWAAPIAFAPKKDEPIRFFVVYCKLNAWQNATPTPYQE